MKRLRVEMKEISEEQREIKVGQKKVREKFEAIELECEELRKETILITQQTANTQIRLALMFQILKARQNQELDKATILTHALRCCEELSVTGQSAKPLTMAQKVPHGGLSIRWGTFSLRELARFKELLEKPVILKPGWPDNEDMAT
ncbi:hypothetical protein Gogos_017870 [Gossypium gossypioides]|uniref:Uncharacterized protein n=4 Tax=Gossypium TaxID=3633 RepID=A0A7J9BC35_GOSGO|nr:hypothetical protein [Gossypium gossypioides]